MMLRRNMIYFVKSNPLLTIVLIAALSMIFCVMYTACGAIASLSRFMTDYGNVGYLAIPHEPMRANQLPSSDWDVEGIREQVFVASCLNREKSAVVVGVFGHDRWTPGNDVDLFWEKQGTIDNLSSLRYKAYLSSGFYNLYEHIEPWVDTIAIERTAFDVVGMADFYFSERGFRRVVPTTQNHGFSAALPPLISASSGQEIVYPEGLGTILLSGHDFIELNLPISFISVVFEQPPSHAQYDRMRSGFGFDESRFDMDPYRTGAAGITLAHVNGLICGVAVLLSVMLTCGLITVILDANQDVWRGLYLLGCTKARVLIQIVSPLTIMYTVAAIISAVPSYFILKYLAALDISIDISAGTLAVLGMLNVLFVVFATLPTCIFAVKKYTREEGTYVQTI